jgi:tRNA(adenine34) deaminase
MQREDTGFMDQALIIAKAALAHDDVPVGCLVVLDGAVIGVGENRRELDNDPTAHAEIVALRAAAAVTGRYRLDGATVYVTLEPCVMCAGALLNARVARVVIGAMDEKAGAVGSRYNVLSDPRLLHEASLTYGVRADEAAALLREFFSAKRSGL